MSYGDLNPYAAPAETDAYRGYSNPHPPLATRVERFVGSLIDSCLTILVFFTVGIPLFFAIAYFGVEFDFDRPAFDFYGDLVAALFAAVFFIIINGYLLATKGQTVGKLVMKTQIVSEETDRILPLGRLLLLRYVTIWIASGLPVVGGFINLANALAIFRANHKCIHDDIAGTKVIKLLS
ncbi:RDD family protein [Novipirellula aureliae]|uniref:RDD family protein n=1 Tax=Novipirellula aureliae TaxID=2527966 RepID=A0A5C6DV79_9BACT|nr:RDD family protein [Novipirellula aureliae]TWU38986.1 RDD family protein [Novipirellula aureliae]